MFFGISVHGWFCIAGVFCGISGGWALMFYRIGQLEKIVTNGLSQKVSDMHDDVLLIKDRCPMCKEPDRV